MSRPRPAVLVLVAGALALAAGTAGIAWAGSGQQVDSIGARPTVTAPTSSAPSSDPDRASDAPSAPDAAPRAPETGRPSPGPAFRSLDRRDATDLPRPDSTPRPERIVIPALDLSTVVDAVGLDADGNVEVPYDVVRTGWYRFSARPGSGEGSVVIVGHRDGVEQGDGAFISLGRLEPGDRIVVTRSDGREIRYEVVARESFAKSRVPLRELFSRSGPERLTLITCGGAFDPAALQYTDNIVVTALPVPGDGSPAS